MTSRLLCNLGMRYFSQSPTVSTKISRHVLKRNIQTTWSARDIFTVQDEKDFQDKVVGSKRPVVVEFHATWCGPCKMLMPRMEKQMVNYNDKVDMAKVDIDELPDVAMEYNVGAVPSVLLIKDGKVLDKFVGLKDEDQIDTFLTNAAKQ
ncbi:thioredoxin, mitochondrial [Folsomia candida]|uniref:Thioredoxin, mitochondrial n=1 Tax=Folsomia candida TaxID=158441 RepID=A0A226ECX9_FOLCA|nr:thioredoxin, mitochondrial [Folsomia candida]OXA55443.1 Thioredoxin, mitochondrial [Folsomia candida]